MLVLHGLWLLVKIRRILGCNITFCSDDLPLRLFQVLFVYLVVELYVETSGKVEEYLEVLNMASQEIMDEIYIRAGCIV